MTQPTDPSVAAAAVPASHLLVQPDARPVEVLHFRVRELPQAGLNPHVVGHQRLPGVRDADGVLAVRVLRPPPRRILGFEKKKFYFYLYYILYIYMIYLIIYFFQYFRHKCVCSVS